MPQPAELPPDEQLVERLFRYLAITSQSDARAETLPSTPGQRVLADLLASELAGLGLDNIHIDANGVLTALRRGSVPDAPCIGFVAHLDTVDVGLSPDIHPQRLRWEGRDLCLNAAQDIWLRAAEHPELARQIRPSSALGRIPVGDLAVVEIYGWPEGAGQLCTDGRAEWQRVDSEPAPGLPWSLLDSLGLTRLIPGRLATVLDREKDRLTLVRRTC